MLLKASRISKKKVGADLCVCPDDASKGKYVNMANR